MKQPWIVASLAVSVLLSSSPILAQVPVNSVNDGRLVQSGTYANTADSMTTFKNTGAGGLWLQKGGNLRGIEVDAGNVPTNNGGTFLFYAPGGVVRLDGNVDVRGLQNGTGAFIGNGGKVFIDSAYLYQSGNIYANGLNGGLVQMNVGAATLTGNARIEAKGFGGQGGVIAMNSSGSVDIGRQAVLDSSGNVLADFDSNVINIEGSLVNLEGTLRAIGIDSRGGTIRLVSSSRTSTFRPGIGIDDAVVGNTLTTDEAASLHARLDTLRTHYDGDIRIASPTATQAGASIAANGLMSHADPNYQTPVADEPIPESTAGAPPVKRTGDGGTIILAAQQDILNGGSLSASGARGISSGGNTTDTAGNGGTIVLTTGRDIYNSGRISADGGSVPTGPSDADNPFNSNGGLLAFSYGNTMFNSGVIRALGKNNTSNAAEGLAVFSGPDNPYLDGVIGAGTVVMPDPATSTNTLFGQWHTTRPVEVLSHAENLVFLVESKLDTRQSLNTLMNQAYFRSLSDPKGYTEAGWHDIVEKSHISSLENADAETEQAVLSSPLSYGDAPKPYLFRNVAVGSITPVTNDQSLYLTYDHAVSNRLYHFGVSDSGYDIKPVFSTTPFNTVTAVHAGSVAAIGTYGGGGLGGGHISILTHSAPNGVYLGNLTLDGGVAGGSIHVAATDDMEQSGQSTHVGLNNVTLDGALHGGSLIAKSRNYISVGNTFYEHSVVETNGGLVGGTQEYYAGHDMQARDLMTLNGGQQGGVLFGGGLTLIWDPLFLQMTGGQANGYVGGGVEINIPCRGDCD